MEVWKGMAQMLSEEGNRARVDELLMPDHSCLRLESLLEKTHKDVTY